MKGRGRGLEERVGGGEREGEGCGRVRERGARRREWEGEERGGEVGVEGIGGVGTVW